MMATLTLFEIWKFYSFAFSNNKNKWRKILNLQEYFVCENENFKIN
jgi:hypothetical protein